MTLKPLSIWFNGELVTTLVSPEAPPRPPVTTTISTVTTTKPTTSDNSSVTPSTSVAFPPSSPSRAHRHTLEFITEAAQELYTKGQLHIKPYAGVTS